MEGDGKETRNTENKSRLLLSLELVQLCSTVEASNRRTGSTLWGEKKCPKRDPENRDPKFNQAVQWWLALAMGKEGGFPLPPGLSSSLITLTRGHN